MGKTANDELERVTIQGAEEQEWESDGDLRKILVNLAEKLIMIKEHEKKLKLLTKYKDFLQKNEDVIEEKYSGLLSDIMRSL